MTEDEIVSGIEELLSKGARNKTLRRIVLGIGDDAALWQPSRSHRSVISADMLVEGVHFTREAMSLEDAGWRAMVANLSDLAAMGARPVLATVSLGVSRRNAAAETLQLYRGIADAASRHKIAVVGGDLTRSDTIAISISVVGEVRPSNVKTRSGGRVNDVLAVTGELGTARAGLEGAPEALGAFRRPQARLEEGRFLAASASVTAMMDCSDGLSTDVHRLCIASGCGAVLEEVPVAAPARAFAQARGEDPEAFALAGGEDFELIAAIRPRAFSYLSGRFAKRFGRPLRRVGFLGKGEGVQWQGRPLERSGWDHFDEGGARLGG
ncbi:MAG TPA: thiamine-phosphate kinase [Candidatus Cybelea sp.]